MSRTAWISNPGRNTPWLSNATTTRRITLLAQFSQEATDGLAARILRVRNDPKIVEQHLATPVEVRRHAQILIETRDAASEDYLKRFYKVNWSDPALYHLLINTGKLTLE